MTREEIIAKVAELSVGFIHLVFTDILGTMKSVAIPVDQLSRALDQGIRFDGSAVEGFVRIYESDMFLRPDPSTFAILPWSQSGQPTARMICDVHHPDGSPFAGCPRQNLKRVIAEVEAAGLSIQIGPEAEFFLFRLDQHGKPTTLTQDQGLYFDLSPLDAGEDARRDMVLALQKMGFQIEASHHENSPGQHEIDFRHADPLTTADNISTLKLVVRRIARDHQLHATFMPKPLHGFNGSGMHLHLSISRGSKNLFSAPRSPSGLSDMALSAIAGLLYHARAITAVTNPLTNSYKRLVPGFEAPVYVAWSRRNRSPLVRIPAEAADRTRIELRSPDPSCNPYLALAVVVKGMLDGIRRRLVPPDPIDLDLYSLSLSERDRLGVISLPSTLWEALAEMETSELLRSALGEHLFHYFLQCKRLEWEIYNTHVHPWEVDQYLGKY